jgi:hypothetical protein
VAIRQMPTTVSHEIRCSDTLGIVAEMADPAANGAPTAADADIAVARLDAMAADLRGCVILAADGSPLAASGDPEPWAEAARGLLAAADRAAGEEITQAHIGTEDGEAFAIRQDGYALIAAADRFTLASLMLFDMRITLRRLAAETVGS